MRYTEIFPTRSQSFRGLESNDKHADICVAAKNLFVKKIKINF